MKKRKRVVKWELLFPGAGDGHDGTDDGGYSPSADPIRSSIEDTSSNKSREEDEVKKRKVNP